MRKLILIKHSKPLVDARLSSEKWRLSEEGRVRCAALAEAVRKHAPGVIVASAEPKAAETGRILAEKLGVALETAGGLGEHDRSNVPMMDSREFISLVAVLFKEPGKLVLGRETAKAALERISAAVDEAMNGHPEGNVAVVTHGTVMALLVASRTGEDGFQLWRRMGLPSMVVFEMPEWKEVERVERV